MIKPYWICDCDKVMARIPPTRGVELTGYRWTNGQRIGVAWSGGSYALRDAIAAIASEWPVNIDWDWGANWNDALIRVELFGEGSWSYIGSIAEQIGNGRPTMRLGWAQWAFDNEDWINLRAVVLHEFGHALGLRHEHLHPENTLDWNLDALCAYYVDQLGWEWPQVEKTWLTTLDPATHTFYPYDSKSVTHYPVEQRFLRSGAAVPHAWNLSDGDRRVGRLMYPKGEQKIFLPAA